MNGIAQYNLSVESNQNMESKLKTGESKMEKTRSPTVEAYC